MASSFESNLVGVGLFLLVIPLSQRWVWSLFSPKEPPPIVSAIDPISPISDSPDSPEAIQKYIADETTRFHRVTPTDWHSQKHNSSIDPKIFDPATDRSAPEIVDPWQHRILLESTPRGTVAMRYCPQNLQFEYACDMHSQLSYDLLNVCAMKFVRTFFCRTLYDDDLTLPTGVTGKLSALRKAIEVQEKEDETKKNALPEYMRGRIAIDPKLTVQKKAHNHIQSRIPKSDALVIVRNQFRRIGRSLDGIPFTQPIARNKSTPTSTLSYADYKRLMDSTLGTKNKVNSWVPLSGSDQSDNQSDDSDDLVVTDVDDSSSSKEEELEEKDSGDQYTEIDSEEVKEEEEEEESLDNSTLLCNEVGYDIKADAKVSPPRPKG